VSRKCLGSFRVRNNQLTEYNSNNIYNEITELITKKKDVVRNVVTDGLAVHCAPELSLQVRTGYFS